MKEAKDPTPTTVEAIAVVALCFGWFIFSSLAAVAAGFPSGGSFNDSSLFTLVLIECVLGALALAFLRYRGYSLSRLLPSPTWQGCLVGLLLLVAANFVCLLVLQALPSYQNTDQPIEKMVEHSHPSVLALIVLSMVNGLYEETFLLGYLVRGFSSIGAPFALGISSLVRLTYHLYQGPVGAVSVLVFGLVLSLFYWQTRSLWPAVFAHTLADASAFTSQL